MYSVMYSVVYSERIRLTDKIRGKYIHNQYTIIQCILAARDENKYIRIRAEYNAIQCILTAVMNTHRIHKIRNIIQCILLPWGGIQNHPRKY